jgi:hypothetical protein
VWCGCLGGEIRMKINMELRSFFNLVFSWDIVNEKNSKEKQNEEKKRNEKKIKKKIK